MKWAPARTLRRLFPELRARRALGAARAVPLELERCLERCQAMGEDGRESVERCQAMGENGRESGAGERCQSGARAVPGNG